MVKNNKGHIVEIASMSSFVSVGIFSDYSASKAALVSFTESKSGTKVHMADFQVSENSFELGTALLMSMSPSSILTSSPLRW